MDKPSVSRNDADIDIEKLAVQTNFIRWQRDFRIIACSKDYWNLYTGQERLLTKPDRHPHTTSTCIEEFRLDMDMYDKQAKRAREATLFLYKFLDPVLRNILGRSFCGAPSEAFGAVKGHFRVSDTKRHHPCSHFQLRDRVGVLQRTLALLSRYQGLGRRVQRHAIQVSSHCWSRFRGQGARPTLHR
jgi:hypothetical protein